MASIEKGDNNEHDRVASLTLGCTFGTVEVLLLFFFLKEGRELRFSKTLFACNEISQFAKLLVLLKIY